MDTLLLPPSPPLPCPAPVNTISAPLHDLVEPFCPSGPPSSLAPSTSYSPPACKKRKFFPEFACQEQLIDQAFPADYSSIVSDSSHTFSPSFTPFPPKDNNSVDNFRHSHLHEDEGDQANVLAIPNNSIKDLEDILSFLWMEDDTYSAEIQSATVVATSQNQQASSDENQKLSLLVADLDWLASDNFGANKVSADENNGIRNGDSSGRQLKEVAKPTKQDEPCNLSLSWPQTGGCWQAADASSVGEFKQDELPRRIWHGAEKSTWEMERSESSTWDRKQAEGDIASGSWQIRRSMAAMDGGRPAWAGPTLLDVESALALSDQHMRCSPALCSTTGMHIPVSSIIDVKALLAQSVSPQPDNDSCGWRQKLQKRSSQEPKYTIKVESEEKALSDGYRWRKYGQKTIKNSPYPRSYYRCSTGRCNAKKQVERCRDEEGLVLVTYEGIHLHHKPILLHKLRMPGDSMMEEEKEKICLSDTEKSPSSPLQSTSTSRSAVPLTV